VSLYTDAVPNILADASEAEHEVSSLNLVTLSELHGTPATPTDDLLQALDAWLDGESERFPVLSEGGGLVNPGREFDLAAAAFLAVPGNSRRYQLPDVRAGLEQLYVILKGKFLASLKAKRTKAARGVKTGGGGWKARAKNATAAQRESGWEVLTLSPEELAAA
jgi:hypothetical protein